MASAITVTSSLSDVYKALNSRSITTTGWSAINPDPTVTTWTANMGLFSDDLSTFWANCATVGYSKCNPSDYSDYSGWALGVSITIGSAALAASA